MAQTQTNIQFGSGVFTFTPNAGNLAANPTPIQLKVLQEASIESKGDLKKLYGQKQVPAATARGKIDITGKAKVAAVDQNDINQIYWGQTQATGGNVPTYETHTPAASVTPNAGTTPGAGIVTDMGVINGSTGLSMLRVPSAPAVGQYSFTPATTGGSPTPAAYVFNAEETAASVIIGFKLPSTTGSTLHINSQLMGYAPVCVADLWNNFRGAIAGVTLFSVTLGMMSIPTKQEDFWVSDIDFSANADAGGNVMEFYNS